MAEGKRRGWWRILGAVLLLLVLLVATAWVVSGTDAFRTWLVTQIQTKVAQETGAKLEIQSLGGSLLFNARVEGLRLSQKGRTLLAVERLELSYSPLALIGGRLKINSLSAVRPLLSLPLPLGGSGGPGLALSVREMNISEGRVEIGGGLAGPLRGASQIDLEGRLILDKRGLRAKLKLHRSLLRLQGLDKPVFLSLETTLVPKRAILHRLVATRGSNQVELRGEMELQAPYKLKARLTAPRLDAAELPVAWPLPARPQGLLALELAAKGPWERLELHGVLSQGAQVVGLGGWLRPASGAMAFTGRLERVALASWGLPQAPVTLNGGWSLASPAWPGSKDTPLNLKLNLSHAAWDQLQAGPVRLKAQWQGERILLENLNLQAPWGRVEAEGRLELPQGGKPLTLEAKAGFKELTLPPGLKPPLPPGLKQVKLSGQIKAQGGLEDLALELDLDKSHLAPGLELDSLQAQGQRQGGQWLLNELHLKSSLANLDAKGAARLEQGEVRFRLAVPDMAALIERLSESKLTPPVALAGALEAKGRLSGPWSHPDLKADITVGNMFTRHAQAHQVYIEADLKNLGPRLSGWAQMTTAGWLSGEIFLERAVARAEFVDGRQVLMVQAEGPETGVSFKLTSRDLLRAPLRASLSDLWVRRGALGRWDQKGAAHLVLGEQEIKVQDFSLRQGQEQVSFSGDIQFAGPIAANLKLDNLKLIHVIGAGANPPPQARLNGEAVVKGTLEHPLFQIKGKVRGLEWPGMKPMAVEFSGDYGGARIEIAGQVLYDGQKVMDMSGWAGLSVSLRPPVWEPTGEGIHLRTTAQALPLALVGSLLPGVRGLRGTARLNLEAGGTFKQPTLRGWLKLDDGRLVVDATGQRVEKIELDLELSGKRLTIRRARAVSDGKLELSGNLTLPLGGPGSLDLDLTSQDLLLLAGPYAQMDLTAKLHVGGDFAYPEVSGRVGVSDIVVRMGLSAPAGLEDVVVLKAGQAPPPLEPKEERFSLPPFLDPLKVDLEASLGQPAHITMADGWMDASGGLKLSKVPGGPLYFGGKVQVKKGLVLLAGRRFEVLTGRLDFAGKDQPNPNLHGQARLNMGTTTVFVEVGGTANNPLINLSSIPPMSQADILSTIIFGRSSAELNKGQSKELSAQALALLGQAGQKEMTKLFGPDLSPDVVTVHNAPSAGPSLEAGKYLSEDLYLRYRQNLGPYGGQNVGLEYRFTRYFSIESTIGNTRDNGVDFVFTRDFDFFRRGKAVPADTGEGPLAPAAQPEDKPAAQPAQ